MSLKEKWIKWLKGDSLDWDSHPIGGGKIIVAEQVLEPPLGNNSGIAVNSTIHVEHSIVPKYPVWISKIVYPEYEMFTIHEYDISSVKEYFHEGQKNGKMIEGNKIHAFLIQNELLKDCLGYRDLEEIQKNGLHFFRTYFKGKGVFGWGTIVTDFKGGLHTPRLFEQNSEVQLGWRSLECSWNDTNPALHF